MSYNPLAPQSWHSTCVDDSRSKTDWDARSPSPGAAHGVSSAETAALGPAITGPQGLLPPHLPQHFQASLTTTRYLPPHLLHHLQLESHSNACTHVQHHYNPILQQQHSPPSAGSTGTHALDGARDVSGSNTVPSNKPDADPWAAVLSVPTGLPTMSCGDTAASVSPQLEGVGVTSVTAATVNRHLGAAGAAETLMQADLAGHGQNIVCASSNSQTSHHQDMVHTLVADTTDNLHQLMLQDTAALWPQKQALQQQYAEEQEHGGNESAASDPWLAVMSQPHAKETDSAQLLLEQPSKGSELLHDTKQNSILHVSRGQRSTAAEATACEWSESRASTGPAMRTRLQPDTAVADAPASSATHNTAVSSMAQETGNSSQNGDSGTSVAELALMQLRIERPDVMMHTTRELRAKVKAMPQSVALAAVGALAELSQNWATGLGASTSAARSSKVASWDAHKQQQKTAAQKHLEGVVARAAAHMQASSSRESNAARHASTDRLNNASSDSAARDVLHTESTAHADYEGWLTVPAASGTAPRSKGKGQHHVVSDDSWVRSSGSNASAAPNAAASAATVAAAKAGPDTARIKGDNSVRLAWVKLETERPDMFACLDEQHRSYISAQPQQRQVQLLAKLCTVDASKWRTDTARFLMRSITNWLRMMRQPDKPKLAAALQTFSEKHPQVVPFMDDALFSRLASLPQPAALIAVEALDNAEYSANWERHCKNHAAWLMGVVTRALKEAGY